jgi:3',5'-cyclic-AMP phosphodiesterase
MLLAQITDFHVARRGSVLDERGRTTWHLTRAIAHLRGLTPRPDAVLCTGDLVDTGDAEEYERLADILASLDLPTYLVAGNHDDREKLRAAFAGVAAYLPREGPLHYAVELGPLRLVVLDTNVPGEPGGRLDAGQLSWLDARLSEEPDRPTIIAQHHPPFRTGMQHMDRMGLEGIEGLAAVIARHQQVERILCGHLHRAITCRFAGTVASTCPSTAHQVQLDLRDPGGLAVVSEPPMCQLHLWTGAALVSHDSYIEPYDVPLVLAEPGRAY